MPSPPTLHMLCGKIAAWKSTLAARLARAPGTVLICEDDWLGTLYGDEMATGADYLRCADKLRAIMGPHIDALLGAGVSVVLDAPANTRSQRAWLRHRLTATQAAHRLHVLDTPDAVCLQRLRAQRGRRPPLCRDRSAVPPFLGAFQPACPGRRVHAGAPSGRWLTPGATVATPPTGCAPSRGAAAAPGCAASRARRCG